MSKDMLGPLTRALVSVPLDAHGLVLDVANKLNSSRNRLDDVKLFQTSLAKFLRDWKSSTSKVKHTLIELIAAGKYDWVNEKITEVNFPMPEGFNLSLEPKLYFDLEPRLYHFNRDISSEDVIKEMKKDGFRPATIWNLLDYGAKNPELQKSFMIFALGSVALLDGDRRVAYLNVDFGERRLDLSWFDGNGNGWGSHCRFLAVRN